MMDGWMDGCTFLGLKISIPPFFLFDNLLISIIHLTLMYVTIQEKKLLVQLFYHQRGSYSESV